MVFIVLTLPHSVPLFCILKIGISDYFDYILRNNWFVCMCEQREGDQLTLITGVSEAGTMVNGTIILH